MKMVIKKAAILFATLAFVVSGCGVSDDKGNDKINRSQNEDSTDTNNGQTNDVNQDELGRKEEQKLSYLENGDQKEETAFLKQNDNQNYSMYVLPTFELTSEEPEKDILYLKENESLFMRIELLSNDVDWSILKETTKLQLSAVSTDVKGQTSQDEGIFKGSTILEASNEEDVATAYLINHKDIKLKLTMFTKKGEDYRDAFIQMGKTILKESQKNE